MERLDSDSPMALPEALELKSLKSTSIGVLGKTVSVVRPRNAILPNSSLEFCISESSKMYLYLPETYVHISFKVTKKNGDPLDPTINTAYINRIGSSIIKSMQLYISNTLVSEVQHSHLLHYIYETLESSKETKKSSWESAGGYYMKTENSETEDGYIKRYQMVQKGGEIHVSSKLLLDAFRIPKIFLNFTPLRLVVHLNDTNLLVETRGPDGIDVNTVDEFKDVLLSVKDIYLTKTEIEISDHLDVSIQKSLLERRRLSYPLQQRVLRTFFLEASRTVYSTTIFSARLPKRVIICMSNAQDFVGRISTSPWFFSGYSLKNAYLESSGKTIPSRPFNLDFDNQNLNAAYLPLVENFGKFNNGISLSSFANGFFFLVFEVAASLDQDLLQLVSSSSTSLRLEFSKPLPENVMLTVIGEYDSILSLDENRIPHLSSLV